MIRIGSGAILCIQCKGSVHVYAMLVTGTGILRRLCFHIWTNTGCIDCLSTLMVTMMSPKAVYYYNLQAKFAGRRAAQHCCHEKGKERNKYAHYYLQRRHRKNLHPVILQKAISMVLFSLQGLCVLKLIK